jgi:hypothetical protein
MSHENGRCATEAEVVYVENKTGCASAGVELGAGGPTFPFCGPQLAIDTISASKTVMVISGPVEGFKWTSGSTGPLSVIGRNAGAIVGGLQVGVHLSGPRQLYVRGIVVRRSDLVGIAVDNDATLRVEHSAVQDNGGGGIVVDAASFDIRNTRITGNGPGPQGTSGGMVVSSIPTGGSALLRLVTVQNNMGPGISCSAAIQGEGIFATGNTPVQIATSCGISPCLALGPTCGAQ